MDGSTPPGTFSARLTRRNGVALVALRGELDLATAESLEKQMARAQDEPIVGIVLDMRELTFMDCTGLRTVLAASKHAGRAGLRFGTANVAGTPRKVFETTGTVGLLQEAEGSRILDAFRANGSPPPSPDRTVMADGSRG